MPGYGMGKDKKKKAMYMVVQARQYLKTVLSVKPSKHVLTQKNA